jgi:hypothetical protein
MEKIWHEIPRKILEADRLGYFVEQLRASIFSQVSASLMPEHKLVWSLLLALQATGQCSSSARAAPYLFVSSNLKHRCPDSTSISLADDRQNKRHAVKI